MEVETIANQARKSISNFCIKDCQAYCCRKGFIALNKKEADLLTNGQTKKFVKSEKIIKVDEKKFALDLGKTCPSLEGSKCSVHAHSGRPKVCGDFPIFIEDKTIRLAENCLAVKNNLFYSYEKQFLQLGYNLDVR